MKSSAAQEELELEEESKFPPGFLDDCLKLVGWNRGPSIEYLAGFFDGEGSVTITTSGHFNLHVLRIFVTNTNENVLRNLQVAHGGRFESRTSKTSPKHWKPSFRLAWEGWRAAWLLEGMMPHLIIKKPQAELGLEFWAFAKKPIDERCSFQLVKCSNFGGSAMRSERVKTDETKRIEAEFKQRMHVLNRRGVHE